MSNVKIVQKSNKTKVWIDGMEVEGVTFIEYKNENCEIPKIIIEFIPNTLNAEMEEEK